MLLPKIIANGSAFCCAGLLYSVSLEPKLIGDEKMKI